MSDYTRVKKILAAAAGGGPWKYAELGSFWELPLEQLMEVKILDLHLIAPAGTSSCCDQQERRSARSGLIRALRGTAPFDGSRFAQFRWDGKPMAEADIGVVAAWIDEGCPCDDPRSIRLAMGEPEIFHAQVTDLEFAIGNTNARRYVYHEGEPRQRANIDCLSDTELDRLGNAFRQLYELDKHEQDRRNYNNQALIHQNHCQHGWERFLPWHRAYVYEFEQNLQDFDSGLMLPYWDWTMPCYRPHEPEHGRIIPSAFQGYLREEQANELINRLSPRLTSEQERGFRELARLRKGFVSQDKFFRHVIEEIGYTHVKPAPADQNRRAMIDALLASNALWYPLRYPAEFPGGRTIEQHIHYHYPSAEDIAQILRLNNFRDFGGGNVYNASFGFLDQNPHNTMHIWTGGQNPQIDEDGKLRPDYDWDRDRAAAVEYAAGERLAETRNFAVSIKRRRFHSRDDLYSQPPAGDMFSNLTASYDPVFWPIHVNVDRLWHEWQTRNPTALPYDLDAVLSPWNYTIRDMLEISRFGYEYVRSSFFMPVGTEAPIGRFTSAPIKIGTQARHFKHAEIRLHWVPQLPRSCFVRAFLNLPGADASTPIRDNEHYAGYLAIFGHGECYGGPGHCDLPPARTRAFDQRTRNHNTPRNHRLDVTAAVRKMLERAPDQELRITLLVIGADYREDKELLRLEGVSLNLLD
ncbi:tyrosinase family protein [Burkholderia sp. ABCPW 14]|uniref:tyrosinase family protein n=1 Tax=Burkholderia sp. ABCPW 14 TaxID=1637860 RepID=UPI000ABA5120|nr:tyrosinase family protein [Burkholderia sp. ABCPW 14]